MHKSLVQFGRVVFELCEWTERQTGKQTGKLIAVLHTPFVGGGGGGSNSGALWNSSCSSTTIVANTAHFLSINRRTTGYMAFYRDILRVCKKEQDNYYRCHFLSPFSATAICHVSLVAVIISSSACDVHTGVFNSEDPRCKRDSTRYTGRHRVLNAERRNCRTGQSRTDCN